MGIGIEYELLTPINSIYVHTKISIAARKKNHETKTMSFYAVLICYVI